MCLIIESSWIWVIQQLNIQLWYPGEYIVVSLIELFRMDSKYGSDPYFQAIIYPAKAGPLGQ